MRFFNRFCEPKLYRYAKELEFEQIIDRCRKYPRAAKREARFRHAYGYRQTALHRLLDPFFLLGIDLEQQCHDLDQEQRQQQQQQQLEEEKHKEEEEEEEDSTPYTVETIIRLRHEAAKALLGANPDAAMVCCSYGLIPIMMVCIDTHPCLDDLEMLVEARPHCLYTTDFEGRTPLHHASIINRTHICMIQRLVELYPDGLTIQDGHGRTPLHYACMANVQCLQQPPQNVDPFLDFEEVVDAQSQQRLCSSKVLTFLLEMNASALLIQDGQGRNPLHQYCYFLQQQQQQQGAWDETHQTHFMAMTESILMDSPLMEEDKTEDSNKEDTNPDTTMERDGSERQLEPPPRQRQERQLEPPPLQRPERQLEPPPPLQRRQEPEQQLSLPPPELQLLAILLANPLSLTASLVEDQSGRSPRNVLQSMMRTE